MSILDEPGLNPADYSFDVQESSYLDDLPDPSRILDDPRVRNDIRAHYTERGESFDDDYEMLRRFWADNFWANTNTAAMSGLVGDGGFGLYDAYAAEGEDKQRLARLSQVYNRLPNFYQGGGASDRFGAGSTTGTIAGSLLTDPLNFIGGASAAKGAALAAAKGAGRGAATWQGVKRAGISEAPIGAAAGGIHSAGIQHRDIELGTQDEFSYGQLAKDMAFEGAAGAAIGGGIIGSITAQRGISVGRDHANALSLHGITPEFIQAQSNDQLQQVFDTINQDGIEAVIPDLLNQQQTMIDQGRINPAQRTTSDIPAPGSPESRQWQRSADHLPANVDLPADRRGAGAEQPAPADPADPAAPADINPPNERSGNTIDDLREYATANPDNEEVQSLLRAVDSAQQQIDAAEELGRTIEAMPEGDRRAALLQQFHEDFAALTSGREQAIEMGDESLVTAPAEKFQRLQEEIAGQGGTAAEAGASGATDSGESASSEGADQTVPADDFAPGGSLEFFAPIAEQYGEIVARRFAKHQDTLSPVEVMNAKQPVRMLRKLARAEGLDTRTGLKADQLRAALELPDELIAAWRAQRLTLEQLPEVADLTREERNDVVSAYLEKAGAPPEDLKILSTVSRDENDLELLKQLPKGTKIDFTLPNGVKMTGTIEEILQRMRAQNAKQKVDSGLPKKGQGVVAEGRKSGSADGRTLLRSEKVPKPGRYNYEAAQSLAKTGKYIDAAGHVRQTSTTADVVEIPSGRRERGEFISKHNLQHHRAAIQEGKITHANTRTGLAYRTRKAAEEAVVSPDDVPPYAFKHEGGKGSHSYKVADATNKKEQHLKKGETAFVDPANGKVYRHYENLLQAKYGKTTDEAAHAPGEEPSAKAEKPAPASEAKPQTGDAKNATLANLVKAVRSGKSRQELRQIIDEGEAAAAEAPPAPKTENPAASGTFHRPGDNRQPAIMITAGQFKGQVRVASPKQRAEFAGEELASKLAGRVQPHEYELGTVPSNIPYYKSRAAAEAYIGDVDGQKAPLPKSEKVDAAMRVVEAARQKESAPPLTPDEAEQITVTLGDLTPVQQRGLNRIIPMVASASSDTPISMRSINNAIHRLHSADWVQLMGIGTGVQIREVLEEIADMELLLAHHVPQGVSKPTQTRRAAIDSLGTVFAGHEPETIDAARVFLSRLNLASEDGAPILEAVPGYPANGYFKPESNTVGISDMAGDGQRPAISTLYHEVGHWAYENLLTGADRVEFFRIVDEHFLKKDNYQDHAAVKKAVPQAVLGTNNGLTSPQEMFANQFDLYVHKVLSGEKLVAHEESFWKRMVQYIKSLFDVYASGEAVHPALEPLFNKILPQESLVKGVDIDSIPSFPSIDAAPDPKTDWGGRLRANWGELNAVRTLVSESEPTPGQLLEAIDFLTAAGTNRKLKAQKKEQAWAPYKQIGKEIRAARAQLVAYMRMLDGDSLDRPVGDGSSTLGEHVGAAWSEIGEDGDLFGDGFQIEEMPSGQIDDVLQKITDFIWLGEKNFLNRGEEIPSLKATLDKMERELASWYFGNEGVLIGKTVMMPPFGEGGRLRKHFAKHIPWMPLYHRTQAAENGIVLGQVQLVRRFNRSHAERKAEAKPSSGKSPKAMTETDLREEIKQNLGTTIAQSRAEELMKKMKAAPVAPKAGVKIPNEVRVARADEHAAMLRKAIRENDTATIDAIEAEHFRRAEKRAAKKLPGSSPKNLDINYALGRERNEWAGEQMEDGIPPSASALVREALGSITHRDPETQIAARSIAYRLSVLDNPDPKSPHLLSAGHIARVAGLRTDPSSDSALPDFQSPAFQRLRKTVRQVGAAINRGDGSAEESVRQLATLVARTRNINDAERKDILAAFEQAADTTKARISSEFSQHTRQAQAERWFAEHWVDFARERVALDDIANTRSLGDDFDPMLRSRLSALHEKMTDSMAYVLNGNIGRDEVKRAFRTLTHYGDMFEPVTQANTRTALGKQYTLDKGNAASYVADTLRTMPVERRRAIKGFVGEGMGANEFGQPIVLYHGTPFGHRLGKGDNPVLRPTGDEGSFGSGVYLTSHPGVADEIYSKQMTAFAHHRLIEDADLPVGEMEQAHAIASEIGHVRVAMRRVRSELAKAEDGNQRAALQEELSGLNEYIAARSSELEKMGVRPESKVMPTYISVANGLDLTAGAHYKPDSAVAQSFLDHINNAHLLDPSAASEFLTAFDTPDGLRGDAVWPHMQQWLQSKMGYDRAGANSVITQYLQAQGYGGLKVEYENNLQQGRVQHTSFVVFDPRNVKHMDADEFDAQSDYLYGEQLGAVSPMPELATAAALGEANMNLAVLPMVSFDMENSGSSSSLTHTLGNIARGRNLDEIGKKVLRAVANPMRMLQDNAARARAWGDAFVSDWLKPVDGVGHFERQQAAMGERLMPLMEKLYALPDTGNMIKRWARDSVGGKQPKSMDRVTRALRRPPGSRLEQQLSGPEREAYDAIRAELAAEFGRMRREGMIIGEVRNGYFPQIWDADNIGKNLPEFREALARYYLREAAANGVDMQPDQAQKLALRVSQHIVEEEGTFFPTKSVGPQGSLEDHLDHRRLIRLDADWASESLSELEGFMANDLQDVLVKYFDGSTRRLDFHKQFGHQNHGFHDYLSVVAGGISEAANLLSQKKVAQANLYIPGFGGDQEALTRDVPQIYPAFGNAAAAMDSVKQAVELIKTGQKEDAYQLLLNANTYQTPAYKKRVRAVVEALAVTKGEKDVVPADDLHHLQGTMNAVQHKPIGTDPHYNASRKASKVIRNFNAVTMLSYTMLTSLPDLVLPILRSGSVTAALKGWAKWGTDPDYRDAMRSTGVAIENLVHQRLTHLHGADSSKATNAFFNLTGLTPWTNLQRKLAGSVGLEAFKAEQKIIAKYAAPGVPLHSAIQPPKVKIAYRRLKHYGLEAFAQEGSDSYVAFDAPDALNDPRLKEALIKFADETIFSPNKVDIPLWTQSPWMSVVTQLKSFPLMMMRLSGDILKRAKEGDRQALYYLATLAPAFGAVALNVKDVAQGRGGEENREYAPRERSFNEWMADMGIETDVSGQIVGVDKDWLGGQYVEGFMHAGGLGLVADMMHQATSQVDNGAYGSMRWLGLFLGPSTSILTDIKDVSAGALSKSDDGNGKERAAWRAGLRRVPLLGGNSAIREAAVDKIAGAPSKGGGGNGSGGGYGDGYGGGYGEGY